MKHELDEYLMAGLIALLAAIGAYVLTMLIAAYVYDLLIARGVIAEKSSPEDDDQSGKDLQGKSNITN